MPSKPGANCESCLMPFSQDPGKRTSDKYCSLCYQNGALMYQGGLKGFQKVCYDAMVARGFNPLKAKIFAWMIRFAPRWKK